MHPTSENRIKIISFYVEINTKTFPIYRNYIFLYYIFVTPESCYIFLIYTGIPTLTRVNGSALVEIEQVEAED